MHPIDYFHDFGLWRSKIVTSSSDIVTFYIPKESLDCLRSLSKFRRYKLLLGQKPQTKIPGRNFKIFFPPLTPQKSSPPAP